MKPSFEDFRPRRGGFRGRRGQGQRTSKVSANERLGQGRTQAPEVTSKSEVNNNGKREVSKNFISYNKIWTSEAKTSQEDDPNANRMTSTEYPLDESGDPACICLRPIMYVFCGYCGYTFKGRVRTVCKKCGPLSKYLMDFDLCPNEGCNQRGFYLREVEGKSN